MKSKAQRVLELLAGTDEANEIEDGGPGQTWLKKNGGELRTIAKQLRKFADKFEKEVTYDNNTDSHTDAIWTLIDGLDSIVMGASIGSGFESLAKQMGNISSYMLKELV